MACSGKATLLHSPPYNSNLFNNLTPTLQFIGLLTLAQARLYSSSLRLVVGKKRTLSMVWMSSSCTTHWISNAEKRAWSALTIPKPWFNHQSALANSPTTRNHNKFMQSACNLRTELPQWVAKPHHREEKLQISGNLYQLISLTWDPTIAIEGALRKTSFQIVLGHFRDYLVNYGKKKIDDSDQEIWRDQDVPGTNESFHNCKRKFRSPLDDFAKLSEDVPWQWNCFLQETRMH